MYRSLAGLLSNTPPDRTTLSVSKSERLCGVLGLGDTTIVAADYPEHDLCRLGFEDETFDFVVSDQVLEHVACDPFAAVAESFRVLKPGGVVVHTTCFINRLHQQPHDYWRFTPGALALLVEPNEVLTSGQWGNRHVWTLERLGLRFIPVPDRRWHPLHLIAVHDEPRWPIVTWVAARKTG